MHGNTQAHIYTHLMKRSSSGLSSRLRGSTLSGNWLMALHNKLRKLVKSVRSSTLSACSNCSRNRTPTSPLLITSASGPSLDPDPSSSSLTSSTSSSCWSSLSDTKKKRMFITFTTQSYSDFIGVLAITAKTAKTRHLAFSFFWTLIKNSRLNAILQRKIPNIFFEKITFIIWNKWVIKPIWCFNQKEVRKDASLSTM